MNSTFHQNDVMGQTKIPKDWREWYEERVALMQYDGKMSLETAEREAFECLQGYLRSFRKQQRDNAMQPRETQ